MDGNFRCTNRKPSPENHVKIMPVYYSIESPVNAHLKLFMFPLNYVSDGKSVNTFPVTGAEIHVWKPE
jgi:hypothetical protein